jgi:myo-inositol 2-dehydrogenase / D-chiro-inositol 1-dehydrogenase
MTWTVAFYGAGERARPYLDALARRPDVTVAAVCDVDRRAAEQSAAGWGAQVFLSYEAMLKDVAPQALWVCVPPHLQGDVLLRAADQNIPFFVDPPGALDYERARLYGTRIAKSNLVTAVGFAAHHTDVVREAREYVGAHSVPLALGWWLRPARDEHVTTADGLLWSEACRLVDALRFFCGEVMMVRAVHAGNEAGGLVVQLEFASGCVGMVTCAVFSRPEPRVELELLGDGWSLSFGDAFSPLRLVESDRTTVLRCMNQPAADHVDAFLNAVAEGKPGAIPTGYAEALRTLAVCHAASVSAREGREVMVAEVEGD